MNPLEFRLIAYALVTMLALGGAGWAGHRLTALHYEAMIAKDTEARNQAVQTAKDGVIADLKLQIVATQAAEKKYDDLKAGNVALAQRFADSLRAYQGLRSNGMSAPAGSAAIANAASQGPCSDPELERLSGEAVKASLDDAAALTALQEWAKP